jgi:hypothetical protein
VDQLAIAVMPIADFHAWTEFCQEISSGDRAEDHRAFLRRGGVTAEHAFYQQTPFGDVMVLVWEGVGPEQLAGHFGSLMQQPATDHERYLRDHVIPKVHGVDTTQPPPPPARKVSTINT